MTAMNEREIPLSKTKVVALLLGSLVLVALGVWLVTLDSEFIETQRRFNSPMIIRGVGIAALVFFGLCGAFAFKKLFDTRPGLVLNSQGIHDNSSGVAAGHIPWAEITSISLYEIQKQKMLVIEVVDPEQYIAKGGAIKQALNRANLELCGSPIAISSVALKIDFDELETVVNDYFHKYGRGG
jgi:hypothetical protein